MTAPEIENNQKRLTPGDLLGRGGLSGYFTQSGKPRADWRVGAEVELLGYTRDTLERIGSADLQAVVAGFSSSIVDQQAEDSFVTEATLGQGDRLTLEPGGQLEFSAVAQRSLVDLETALRSWLERMREIGDASRIVFLATGFDPLRGLEEQKWIPKRRYEIMRPYLRTKGRRAWDMMSRTASIQVNLDYGDLEDLAKKFVLANRLAPIAAAIFANSPFEEGRLSGYKSTRYAAWLQTDPDRTGPSPPALEDAFSIDKFIDYVGRVPMFFIRRDGEYLDLTGQSFVKFVAADDYSPVFQDFIDHLSTIFTEARLRPYVEQRSADAVGLEMAMAAAAFWKGLMYDGAVLDYALARAPSLDAAEYGRLQADVARRGLDATIGSRSVCDIARQALEIARDGLRSVARHETRYLDILDQYLIREGVCPADILIRNFEGSWNGNIKSAVESLRI